MSLFDNPQIDAAYERTFNPPALHEIDSCTKCHEAGEHEGQELEWGKKCMACNERAPQLRPMIEIKFNYDQYLQARVWEKENKFRYGDDVTHLLLDWAFKERVKWEEL